MPSPARIAVLCVALCACLAVGVAAAAEDTPATGKPETYYSVLDVPLDADANAVKRAYRTVAKKMHPDRARNPSDREARQRHFVKISNAYEILSDEVLRARYDYLLSLGVYEYVQRDWRAFDGKRGLNRKVYTQLRPDGTEEFVFKDAFQQYQDVAEERALIVSLLFSLLAAVVPVGLYYYRRWANRVKVDKGALRDETKALQAAEKAKEAERLARVEEQRLRQREAAEERRREAEAEEEDDEEGGGEGAGAGAGPAADEKKAAASASAAAAAAAAEEKKGVQESTGSTEVAEASAEGAEEAAEAEGFGGAAAADTTGDPSSGGSATAANGTGAGPSAGAGPASGGGAVHKCALCRRSYKSEQQMEQHLKSAEHVKNAKAAQRAAAR